MSEIPSSQARWEPPRFVKYLFVSAAALIVFAFLAGKVWNATVGDRVRAEAAINAEPKSMPAPPFQLRDRKGRLVDLASFRGKVVFLNFWATWCPPCRDEMPSLENLARRVAPESAVFLAVSVDESWDPVDKFFQGRDLPFELLLDPESKVSRAYGTTKFPESFVIDADGRVVYKFVGERDWNEEAALRVLEFAGARARMTAPPR